MTPWSGALRGAEMTDIYVCHRDELKDGDVRIVQVDRNEVGVYRYSGEYYAYRNHCLHQGGPACEGILRPKVVDVFAEDKSFLAQTYDENDPHIVCPWHGWEYKLKTGECAPDPSLRLKSYKVFERDGGVYVVV
jgi:nitrite reductase/ring-hydroxylating ferredoxin subunit